MGRYTKIGRANKRRYRIKVFDKPAETHYFGERVWIGGESAVSVTISECKRTKRRCDMCEELIYAGMAYMTSRHLRIPEWGDQMGMFRTCQACLNRGRIGVIAIEKIEVLER